MAAQSYVEKFGIRSADVRCLACQTTNRRGMETCVGSVCLTPTKTIHLIMHLVQDFGEGKSDRVRVELPVEIAPLVSIKKELKGKKLDIVITRLSGRGIPPIRFGSYLVVSLGTVPIFKSCLITTVQDEDDMFAPIQLSSASTSSSGKKMTIGDRLAAIEAKLDQLIAKR